MSTEQSNIGASRLRTGGIRMPSFRLPKSLAERELLAALVVSAMWTMLVLGYGAGFFGLFGGLAAPRSPVFLEVGLFVLGLILPLLFIWLCAYLVWNMRVVNHDARELHRIVANMEERLSKHTPVTSAEIETAMANGSHNAMLQQRDALEDYFSRIKSQVSEIASRQDELSQALAAQDVERSREKHELAALVASSAKEISQVVPKAPPRKARRKLSATPAAEPGQSALPLESHEFLSPDALRWEDLLRALNFPENGEDKAGFVALRKVLPNRAVALLLQAAEDVLSMLAQEGVYMDDLQPKETDPDAWAAFVSGTRGAEVSAVGAVQDEAALALARGRMKGDTVFRDATLHFLRQFDGFLQEFMTMSEADDIVNLAHTRTGRAFMLMARASGTFDQ